jgi:hypothetical protein
MPPVEGTYSQNIPHKPGTFRPIVHLGHPVVIVSLISQIISFINTIKTIRNK